MTGIWVYMHFLAGFCKVLLVLSNNTRWLQMQRLMRATPRDNVVPGTLLRRPLFDVASLFGNVLAAANPTAPAAFGKIVLLHPHDASIWVHDTLTALE
jgi:hypothetical protein